MHPFEDILSISQEDFELELRSITEVPWSDLLLNPRRLRGSDFLMRWSQGVWSEKRVIEAVNATKSFFAIPYGPSGTAPSDDVREFELYFERLEKAGLGDIKRPDVLIYSKEDKDSINKFLDRVGGTSELSFIREDEMKELIQKAIIAVECENSLWIAEKMPDFNSNLRPMKRLNGKRGLPKNAVLPTIIIKEEERKPLKEWQKMNKIPIHVWHVFFDRAYGISLDYAEKLISDGLIQATEQTFQAPGGATTEKAIYKIYYHYSYPIGKSKEQPELVPDFVQDKNGHILPYVKFKGGTLELSDNALKVLRDLRR